MTFTPTAEQQLIIDNARNTANNIIISALAGAAKTSTLVMIAEALPSVSMLCLSFNKKIATEMSERLPANCTAMTLNSLGHRTWAEAIGKRLTLDTKKNYDLLSMFVQKLSKKEQEIAYEEFSDTLKLIEMSKACGHIPDNKFKQAKRLMSNQDFFDHLEDEASALQERLIIEVATASIEQGLGGKIDFSDQILLPTLFPAMFPSYPLVLIDEAQDLSALNHATLRKLAKKRLIAVGDPCQPAGTLVSVLRQLETRWQSRVIEQVPIEQLQIGDTLVGYDTQYSEFLFNRKVTGITARPFSGKLVRLISLAGISNYTPNHHCFANFSRLRKHTALYLMRKGNKFRLGVAAMDYGQSSGPIARSRAEQADAMWVLTTFASKQEALINEAAIQASFGIPDITFAWAGGQSAGYAMPEQLAAVWEKLNEIDFTERAKQLLELYGREIDYPLWEKSSTYFTFKRPIVVRACNLLNGGEILPFTGKKREYLSDWCSYEIKHVPYTGLVYSLSVSHNQLFVADGIVTHNCQAIYGFRGAHEESMELLQRSFNMQSFQLSISFRCPISVVKAAQWRAPHMRWPEWAIEGEVKHFTEWNASTVPQTAAIICRNNAPLFSMAIKLLKNGRYPQIIGNDIGKYLLKVMKKFGKGTMERAQVMVAISEWAEEKKKKTRNPSKVEDQAACLRIFADQGDTLSDALAYAEHLFASQGPIQLMTGHKCKGLEFDIVFILDKHLIRVEEGKQEHNLLYVCQTRAKRALYYVESDTFHDDNEGDM